MLDTPPTSPALMEKTSVLPGARRGVSFTSSVSSLLPNMP